jgi:fructose-specific phosphotransferase system IIC component
MVGASASRTVIGNSQVASGATPFVAVHATDVVPTGKTAGEVTGVVPTLQLVTGGGMPVAVALKCTDAMH